MTTRDMPSYAKLCPAELSQKAQALVALSSPCRLCPHECSVRRVDGETGICRSTFAMRVSSDNLHFGEEPCLVGGKGSGTVFLTNCNLRCSYCQNYPISQMGNGRDVTVNWLADAMLRLQRQGAVNINFVSPTHYAAQIVQAVAVAAGKGLNVPLVWNSGGYEKAEVIKLLEGIVDIYLPDAKYSDDGLASDFSGAKDYAKWNREAIIEMWRQAGSLKLYEGVAVKGLLIRHLVLPGQLENTRGVLEFIASLGAGVIVSVMFQYFPAFKAVELGGQMAMRVSRGDWRTVKGWVEELGLNEGYIQQL